VDINIVVDLALVGGRAPLRALADVAVRVLTLQLTIRRCAIFQKSSGPAWASLPRLSVEKNGTRQLVSLIDLPRELRERVLDAVLAAYRRKLDAP
jgi:hypothetical protein